MHAGVMNSTRRSKSSPVIRTGHVLSRLGWLDLRAQPKPRLAFNISNITAAVKSSTRPNNTVLDCQHPGGEDQYLIAAGESSSSDHVRQNHDPSSSRIPKGFLAVYVGPELRRFVVPASYLSVPEIRALMDEAAEEFGYHHQGGGIRIPNCDEHDFHNILTRCLAMHQSSSKRKLTHETPAEF